MIVKSVKMSGHDETSPRIAARSAGMLAAKFARLSSFSLLS